MNNTDGEFYKASYSIGDLVRIIAASLDPAVDDEKSLEYKINLVGQIASIYDIWTEYEGDAYIYLVHSPKWNDSYFFKEEELELVFTR